MITLVLVFFNAKLTELASETNAYTKPVVNQRQEKCAKIALDLRILFDRMAMCA